MITRSLIKNANLEFLMIFKAACLSLGLWEKLSILDWIKLKICCEMILLSMWVEFKKCVIGSKEITANISTFGFFVSSSSSFLIVLPTSYFRERMKSATPLEFTLSKSNKGLMRVFILWK